MPRPACIRLGPPQVKGVRGSLGAWEPGFLPLWTERVQELLSPSLDAGGQAELSKVKELLWPGRVGPTRELPGCPEGGSTAPGPLLFRSGPGGSRFLQTLRLWCWCSVTFTAGARRLWVDPGQEGRARAQARCAGRGAGPH